MIHMTPGDAQTRLQDRYGIETTVYFGDLLGAGEELRERGPFVADLNLDNPPDALLDWVALRAHTLAADESVSITSESVGDISANYGDSSGTGGQLTQNERRLQRLISPYLARRGRVA